MISMMPSITKNDCLSRLMEEILHHFIMRKAMFN